jgi:hypothetical protein
MYNQCWFRRGIVLFFNSLPNILKQGVIASGFCEAISCFEANSGENGQKIALSGRIPSSQRHHLEGLAVTK